MNYFELYKLPVGFLLDEKLIRKKYLELSKKYHPDFYTKETAEKQNEILQLSTLNNKAFQTLSDFNKRMKYILTEKGFVVEEEKYTLPQIFLMEMMDLNETLMDIQFDPDPEKKQVVNKTIDATEKKLFDAIEPLLKNYTEATAGDEIYTAIKEFYYKRKYLLRIRLQLDKFAAP